MSANAQLVNEFSVELMMDYGHFCLHGIGADDEERHLNLLDRAQVEPPSAGDGRMVVVTSPYQCNFGMPVTVEIFDAPPDNDDREQWQQVSQARLHVGPRRSLVLSSSVDGWTEVSPVEEGDYLVEMAGRGFADDPGPDGPADSWRIRLWPDDGTDPLPAQHWKAPTTPAPEVAPAEDAEQERREWGGEPIPALAELPTGLDWVRYDRPLAEAIAVMDEPDLRRLAAFCAVRAYECAGLAELPWIAPAMAALRAGDELPPPFHSMGATHKRFEAEFPYDTRTATATTGSAKQPNPFDNGPIHRPSCAVNAVSYAVEKPDPIIAAVFAFLLAARTFGNEVDILLADIRTEFGDRIPPV
ncbi:hypothetical protein NN3_07580 [Nocardia neocaledoniensis NBRC 108232]|uniref:Uncharacterized protein n=1 Tax=Nocardia neocaledoniensis TaxID=236511 RepID=A0A317NF20_9NOCA|nr:hypothetical protein [Nocardia neocaledoniensis]PWV73765.1 hypothetical protein DFR69_107396 [Nocardia neocaledoniensis]GEM29751.1 hypothetical protein NN3_07580 [Nocardia neocaledoniensis NBRC 108232]